MAQVKIRGQSGGSSKINGIIEEYKVASGGNVNAGDFVKFINEYNENETELSTDLLSTLIALSLSENKVFLVYGRLTLLGRICTISNGTILLGIETQLTETISSGIVSSVTQIDSNRIFITYCNSTIYLTGIVCSILGDEITIGTNTQLYEAKSTLKISSILVDNDKIMMSFGKETSTTNYLYLKICTITGDAISCGNQYTASDIYYSNFLLGLLTNNKVFIVYQSKSNNYIYIISLHISGTTITFETATQILSDKYPLLSMVNVNENEVFITYEHNVNNTTRLLKGIVCNVSENIISSNNETIIDTYSNTKIILQQLKNGNILGVYNQESALYERIFKILKGKIIFKEKNLINTTNSNRITNISTILLNNKIIVVYDAETVNLLTGNLNLINKSYITDEMIGIAKTEGTAGQTVKVIVPNQEEGEN